METIKLKDGYDRKKNPRVLEFTLACPDRASVLALKRGQELWMADWQRKARIVRVSSVKTWKRDPNRVVVTCKYGLREHFTLSLDGAMTSLLTLKTGG